MLPNEIINKLRVSIDRLEDKNEELKELSIEKAERDKAYKIAKAKVIVRLRVESTPIGIINDIAEGEVANLKLEKELAEDNYYICLQAIENLRKELEVYRGILSFLKVEYENS